jgi:caffeoyl-CoA O-methyltransferase
VSPKTLGLDDALHAYVVAHTPGRDEVLRALAAETRERFPELSVMQIAPEQGALLTLLARLKKTRFAVEVGTFTGYSAICIARGLADGGRLVCFDRNEEWAGIAARYWVEAGVSTRIELRLGDASETLDSLRGDPPVDLAFIDADKPGYPRYFETLLARMAPDGLIVVDNVLAQGRVLDPGDDENATAIAAFNELVAADPRVEGVLVPVADGLTLVTRVGD